MRRGLLLCALIAAAPGCCGSSSRLGELAQTAGTLPDGTAFIQWLQTYDESCFEFRSSTHVLTVLVAPDGETTQVTGFGARPLKYDCSDEPARLGLCVPASRGGYDLPGGDRITVGGGLTRTRPDGTTVWTLDGPHCGQTGYIGADGPNPIRGATLLVQGCPSGVQLLAVETGGILWSVPPEVPPP